jgi:hypothetical protein
MRKHVWMERVWPEGFWNDTCKAELSVMYDGGVFTTKQRNDVGSYCEARHCRLVNIFAVPGWFRTKYYAIFENL